MEKSAIDGVKITNQIITDWKKCRKSADETGDCNCCYECSLNDIKINDVAICEIDEIRDRLESIRTGESDTTTRKACLESAIEIVCKDREDTYGSPEDNFDLIAALWTEYTGTELSSKDVAMMMALLKIARIKTGKYKADNFIDLAGYAACACEIGDNNEN